MPYSTLIFFLYYCPTMAIRPQEGFQTMALSTAADIAVMGGSAGCGKTFTLLCEFTRHSGNGKWGGVIFRRTTVQVTSEGGLWDTSMGLFPSFDAQPSESKLTWRFPSGCKLKFAHLEYDKNVLDWQGSQIGFIGFDELTHFTEEQFFYMLSRNRSEAGPKPYVRATCNPDPDSWVAKFIEWWIDQDTGYPIPERAGVLRYMVRDGDVYVWGDTVDEVVAKCPHIFNNAALLKSGINTRDLVKSVTFIPGSIFENKIFLKEDPAYVGNLLSLKGDEKARLLDGNWKIRTDGMGLCDDHALIGIFDNRPEPISRRRCITVDAARFGRDLCVILVWRGWEVIHTVVYAQSDPHDIVKKIEELRRKFFVQSFDVIVDQDGVGGGTLKLGKGYRGFRGGNPALRDPETRVKENYKNLKTQCYYRFCERRINAGLVKYNYDRQFIEVYDDSKLKGQFSTQVKVKSKVYDIKQLILQDFRSVKRKDPDMEGKIQMITKEEQKNILQRSPDFGDAFMMREALELFANAKNIHREN